MHYGRSVRGRRLFWQTPTPHTPPPCVMKGCFSPQWKATFRGVGMVHLLFLTLCSLHKHNLPTFFSSTQTNTVIFVFGFWDVHGPKKYFKNFLLLVSLLTHILHFILFSLPPPTSTQIFFLGLKVYTNQKNHKCFGFFCFILMHILLFLFPFFFPPMATNKHLDHGFWGYMDPKNHTHTCTMKKNNMFARMGDVAYHIKFPSSVIWEGQGVLLLFLV